VLANELAGKQILLRSSKIPPLRNAFDAVCQRFQRVADSKDSMGAAVGQF
jgi:hypothetical protein